MKEEIDQTAFDGLLLALDADRETAGAKYVELRENLVKFFFWRGFTESEEHADETINRAARRLSEGEQIQDFRTYTFGIARMMCLEINRHQIKKNRVLEELPKISPADPGEKRAQEIKLNCLQKCLGAFDENDKNFVLAYYQGERGAKIENRKLMQTKLNLSGSSFRMKALRLREKLESCVQKCSLEFKKSHFDKN